MEAEYHEMMGSDFLFLSVEAMMLCF